jgi:hypothetical protein
MVHFFGFEAGSVCLESTQIDSYLNLSEDLESKSYHKVSPMRGTHRFKVKGKLAPRYVGPFKIVDRRGEVAYQRELSPQLSNVHDVYHVSQLKKCL